MAVSLHAVANGDFAHRLTTRVRVDIRQNILIYRLTEHHPIDQESWVKETSLPLMKVCMLIVSCLAVEVDGVSAIAFHSNTNSKVYFCT